MKRSSGFAACAALWLFAVFNLSDAYDPETGFALGIYGPITQITQDDLAAAVLFDLDFRKHRDPELRERLGPPIVNIPNLHPDLKVKVQLGASDGQKTTGVATALDWLYGENGTQKVVGIVGGYYSAISMPIASNCEVFKTPQIAFGSTNRMLTDKTLYPWFLRTIAPDNFQGQAMWAWMNVAGVPSVVFFYRSLEAYGEGLFQVTFDEAFAVGQPSRVSGIGVDLTGDVEGDRTATIQRLDAIKALGTKFVIMVFSSPGYATLGLHAMDEQGMLYSSHQVLGADSLAIVESNVYKPSKGYPQGCMKFTPVTAGPLHAKFASTWHSMTPEDVYGPAARSRYNIDKFRAPMDQAATAKLVASDFTDRLPWFFSNFLVDAAYSFVVAINNLLNAGIPANQVYGEPLLKELRNLSFEGVTGQVAFDENADRIADWELWNVKQEGGELQSVAVWLATATNMYESFQFRDPTSQELVWVTGETRLQAPTVLTACALGQRWDETAGLCIFCQLNEKGYSDSNGGPACQACPLGTVSEQPLGSLACTACAPGSYRDGGLQSCTACAPGTYMAELGQSACIACPAGRFTSKPGALSCDLCGPGGSQSSAFTTMDRVMDSNGEQMLSIKTGADSDSFCGCRQGYRQAGLNGGCVECKEGMVCKGLNETTIEEGYYADVVSADGDLSVFKCFSDSDRCAGGVPGQTCAPGRKGLTCSECQDGKTPKSDGSCAECHGSDVGPFVAAVSLGVICLIAAYHLVDTQNRVTQSHALLLAACAIGQLVTVTQQLGVVGKMAATWEEPIDSFMKVLQLLALDLEVLRLNCVGTVDPSQRFGIKVTIIFMTIAVMLIIHAFFVSLRHKCQWKQRMHSLVGSIGMLFMVFNIAVTSAVLEPFQCEKHPNGKWTVRPYPSVLCWDGDSDHAQMVAGGAVAFVLVPVAFLVACYFVVKQFPKKMKAGDSQFLHAFAFLFFRFRASQHWYVLYQMLRNFGVAVVLLIPDAAMQVFVLELILLIGVCATIYLWPWRVDYANILDCIFGCCALMIVCLAGLFLDDDQKHLKGTAWLTLIFICACLFSTPLAIMYGLYCKYCRSKKPFQFFLCHHKSGSGAFVRLLKMHIQDSPQLRSDVFVDSDNLENLDRLFDHVGNDTENLTVVCTDMVFTRPWCVGEMCVARLKKVTTMLVTLPNHVLPDADFISEILERISDTEVLTENGISEEIIRETLRWIGDNVTINMPKTITARIMDLAAAKMFTREPAEIKEDHIKVRTTTEKPEQAGQSVMLFDLSNVEAASTALILRKLLMPHLTHDTRKIPKLIQEGSIRTAVSDDCGAVIVMCTKGVFENADILKFFIRISGLFLTFLPLICEQSFSVPRKDIVKTWQKNLPSAAFTQEELSTASFVVTSLFKEIAVHFDAKHSSLNILDVAASSVARRLLTDKNKIAGSTSIPMGGSASIGRQLSKPSTKSAGKTYSSETSAQTPVDSGSFSITSVEQATGADSADVEGFDLQMSL